MTERQQADEKNSLENSYNHRLLVRFVNTGGLDSLPRNIKHIVSLYLSGKSLRAIARQKKLSHTEVTRRMKKAGEMLRATVGRWIA